MAAFDKLSKAFDQGGENTRPDSKTDGMDVVKKSLAIVKAIDKLKSQGIKITKKAQLDYILALRILEKSDIDPSLLTRAPAGETESDNPAAQTQAMKKRNPKDHPKEFQAAMAYSKKTAAEIEDMLKKGQAVPDKKMKEYKLCKKFLEKYTDLALDVIKNEWISKTK